MTTHIYSIAGTRCQNVIQLGLLGGIEQSDKTRYVLRESYAHDQNVWFSPFCCLQQSVPLKKPTLHIAPSPCTSQCVGTQCIVVRYNVVVWLHWTPVLLGTWLPNMVCTYVCVLL